MEIKFKAILSGSSAITISDDGSTKLKLEVPASELPEVMKLVTFTNKCFDVEVREET